MHISDISKDNFDKLSLIQTPEVFDYETDNGVEYYVYVDPMYSVVYAGLIPYDATNYSDAYAYFDGTDFHVSDTDRGIEVSYSTLPKSDLVEDDAKLADEYAELITDTSYFDGLQSNIRDFLQ